MTLIKSPKRRAHFTSEYAMARRCYDGHDLDGAFHHLERAHVLGQPWAVPHTKAHWLMLKIGVRRRDMKEVFGQIIRLTGGGLLSILGRLPEGNTGGANVSAEQPMPLSPDLKALCEP